MTVDRVNSCPAFRRQFDRRRDPWDKVWWRKLMLRHYREARLARIMQVERKRALPDWLWAEKRALMEHVPNNNLTGG